MARTRARRLRFWLIPCAVALAGGMLAAAAYWLVGKVAGGKSAPVTLRIQAGLHHAVAALRTPVKCRPVLEVRTRDGVPRSVQAPAEGFDHEVDLPGLEEDTDYQVRALLPGTAEAPYAAFHTLRLALDDVSIQRRLDAAEVRWSTRLRCRAVLAYWPTGTTAEAATQSAPSVDEGHEHRAVATELVPDKAYTLVISSFTPDGEVVKSQTLSIPGVPDVIAQTTAVIQDLSSPQLFERMRALRRELARQWPLERAKEPERDQFVARRRQRISEVLGSHLARWRDAMARFEPVARYFFASESVLLEAKLAVAEWLAAADQIASFCKQEGLEPPPTLPASARPGFRMADESFLAAPEVHALFHMPGPALASSPDFLVDNAVLGKLDRVTRSVTISHASAIKAAEVRIELSMLSHDCVAEVQVNDHVRLWFIRPPGGPVWLKPAVLFHELPPAALVEGENRITFAFKPSLGCLCFDTPRLDGLDVRVRR